MARTTVDAHIRASKAILGGGRDYLAFCATIALIAAQVWFCVAMMSESHARGGDDHFLFWVALVWLIIPTTAFLFLLPILMRKGGLDFRRDALYVAFWFMTFFLLVPVMVMIVGKSGTAATLLIFNA